MPARAGRYCSDLGAIFRNVALAGRGLLTGGGVCMRQQRQRQRQLATAVEVAAAVTVAAVAAVAETAVAAVPAASRDSS
jgi:hypothetical protein